MSQHKCTYNWLAFFFNIFLNCLTNKRAIKHLIPIHWFATHPESSIYYYSCIRPTILWVAPISQTLNSFYVHFWTVSCHQFNYTCSAIPIKCKFMITLHSFSTTRATHGIKMLFVFSIVVCETTFWWVLYTMVELLWIIQEKVLHFHLIISHWGAGNMLICSTKTF